MVQRIESRLTVFYDGSYWIGIYERISAGQLEACKITFGAEPKDYEVYEYLLQNWNKLRFSPPVSAGENKVRSISPKRRQRIVRQQLEAHGTGTKSQEALKLQREEGKQLRSERRQRQREEEKQRQFELKQQKRKEKHRGR